MKNNRFDETDRELFDETVNEQIEKADNKQFDEIDRENLEIAKRIVSDSEKINADNVYDENLLDNAESKTSRKVTFKRNIFKISGAVAACIALAIGYRTMEISPDISHATSIDLPVKENEITKTGNTKHNTYNEIYERMKYVGSIDYYINETAGGYYDAVENVAKEESMSSDKTGNTASDTNREKSYYDTNEQTQNVHEGDIVKTDGKYIYTLKFDAENGKYNIIITQVEGKNLKDIGRIKIKAEKNKFYNIDELYVDEEKLIAVGSANENNYVSKSSRILYDCLYTQNSSTVIFTYDISDRNNPKLISKNVQDGRYVSSRLSNGYLYTISEKYMDDFSFNKCVPYINEKRMMAEDVYLPGKIKDKTYTVITSLSLNNADKYATTVAVASGASNIYVSDENIYLIEYSEIKEHISNLEKSREYLDKCKFVLSDMIKDNIKYTKKEIRRAYEDVKSITYTLRDEVFKVTNATNIVKYKYDGESIDFVAEKTIKGTAGNNLFFDEKDGYLRFVTTEQTNIQVEKNIYYYDQNKKEIYNECQECNVSEVAPETNNVFVLDSDLEIKAQIDKLAKNESVYSARYFGDYGYFVTYENADPLFSVDFSDMENPKIIGELKMPGYSSYLHFYTERSLFGMGMETDEKTGNEIGLKLEMYEISGGSAEKKAKTVIPDIDYSTVLYNYKALMIDSGKGLIGFSGECYSNNDYYEKYYLYKYENRKFKKVFEDVVKNNAYNIRGFYIDDYFYIVEPEHGIKVINLNTYKVVGKMKF